MEKKELHPTEGNNSAKNWDIGGKAWIVGLHIELLAGATFGRCKQDQKIKFSLKGLAKATFFAPSCGERGSNNTS